MADLATRADTQVHDGVVDLGVGAGREIRHLIAELRPAAGHVILELRADRVVHRRPLVLVERPAPDLAGARGGVAAALPLPAVEVLRRAEQRPVEALAEALQRVRRAEEVPAGADLL